MGYYCGACGVGSIVVGCCGFVGYCGVILFCWFEACSRF